MSWAKLSERFYSAPQVLRAKHRDLAAVGLFALGASYSAQALNAFVPDEMVEQWLPKRRQRLRAVEALLDTDLWQRVDRGFTFELSRDTVLGFGIARTDLSASRRAAVIQRDGLTCRLCGQSIESSRDLHIDHVVPVAHGGSDELENLQVAHAFCNLSKGAGGG